MMNRFFLLGIVVCNLLSASVGTVCVIETSSSTIKAKIPVGSHPHGIAVTPNGAYAYVADTIDGTITVINTASNTIAAVINTGRAPLSIAITPNGTYAYVTDALQGIVTVIQTTSNTIVDTITIGPASGSPDSDLQDIVISPDGAYVYARCRDQSIAVIETASNTVKTKVNMGADVFSLAITPDGTYIYATLTNEHKAVSVLETTSYTIKATVEITSTIVNSIAITPDGRYACVGEPMGGGVIVIDTSSNTIRSILPPSQLSTLSGLTMMPNKNYAYVALVPAISPPMIGVFDVNNNVFVNAIQIDHTQVPADLGVAMTLDGRYAYVAQETSW